MRNLKRALSLTLASVMLLGVMVVGSSAVGFPDVDEEDNVEAIEVLNAVDVIRGYDNGDFGPDDLVTRSQMAVIMANLLKLDYQYYEATCPFTDVPAWARGYVGACYANGITSGYSATIYGSNDGITPVQAASMMMRALGYFKYADDYKDGFEVVTVRQGSQIGIFDGVGSSATAQMTRDQVAKMALNALESEMVTFTGTPGIEIDGRVVGYRAEYTPRTSTETKYQAIEDRSSDVSGDSNHRGQYYIQLGEELYDGKLRLTSTTDAFQRPARYWEYNGKAVGTYVKEELLRQVWTEKVTGKMLYDLLTKSVIEGSSKYDFTIAIDGVTGKDALTGYGYFDEGYLNNNHKEAVGATGNGVTTEVYVDSANEQVYIAVINTYLAKATGDYNATRETVTYNVYGLDNNVAAGGTTSNPIFVKNLTAGEDKEVITVSADDFNIAGVKKDDIVLVHVADGTIQIMREPEVMAGVSLTAFAKHDYVIADGSTIKYNNAAEYDTETLEQFTGVSGTTNLRDKHYNLYLDRNGYIAGIEVVEEDANYIFLTGIDAGLSDLTNKTSDAAGILMDGTFVNIQVNMEKSTLSNGTSTFSGGSMWNTWCTYSVDNNNVYTLKQVGADPQAAGSGKVAQVHSGAYVASNTTGKTINIKNYTLPGTGSYSYVYGNENSVYMTAKLKSIKAKETMTGIQSFTNASTPVMQNVTVNGNDTQVGIISGVDTRTVGIANTDMTTWTQSQMVSKFTPSLTKQTDAYPMPSGVYTLFNDKGYVVASIVIGEDNGIATNLVLVNSDDIKSERWEADDARAATAGEWIWTRKAINLNTGEIIDLEEKGDAPDVISLAKMPQWTVAQVKLNGDGFVTGANKGSAITGAAYENVITNLENTISTSNKDLVVFQSSAIGVEPWFSGNTLHVDYTSDKGVPVHSDVKTVLIKKTDGASETTPFSGSSELDTVLATLNKDKSGKVSFRITALIKGGQAITIVVDDLNKTSGQINNITSGTLPNGGMEVDTSAAANIGIEGVYDIDNEKLYLQFTSKTLKNCTTKVSVEIEGTSMFNVTTKTTRTFTVKMDANGVSEVVTMDYAMNMGNFGNVLASVKVKDTAAPTVGGKTEIEGDVEEPISVPAGGEVTVGGDVEAAIKTESGSEVNIGGTEGSPSQVTAPITGSGTTNLTGPTNGGNNVMTDEVVAKPGSSFTGTIGDADSGNPSNLTFDKDVDEVDSVWNVSGSITIDHDITVVAGGGLNAPQITVAAGTTLTLDRTATLSVVELTVEAGATVAYYKDSADDLDDSCTFTKESVIRFYTDEWGNNKASITNGDGTQEFKASSKGWYATLSKIFAVLNTEEGGGE